MRTGHKSKVMMLLLSVFILIFSGIAHAQTAISTCSALQAINSAGSYYLANDISCSASSGWNSGAGFAPISNFTGTLDGKGYTISNLTINRPGQNRVGLFANIENTGHVRDLSLANAHITGGSQVGTLAGYMFISNIAEISIVNSHVTGTSQVGGLLGESYNGTGISQCVLDNVTVNGSDEVGGLVGRIWDGTLNNIFQSSVKAAVIGTGTGSSVGGIAGYSKSGDFIESYSEGTVQGNNNVGGIAGLTFENAGIHNCYSKSSVTGNHNVGGIAGFFNSYDDGVRHTYFAGTVAGNSLRGAFLGDYVAGTVNSNYWDTTLNPGLPGAGDWEIAEITGKTTAQMFQQNTYIGWDFIALWIINGSYPELRAFLSDVTKEYVRAEADYILACQYDNAGNNADGAINNVTGAPTWVVPRENGLAILGLIKAAELLGDQSYLDEAQRAADYLVRVQDIDNQLNPPFNKNDGAWYNQYSFDQPHDNIAKSPLATAEVMLAFHKLGFNAADAARKDAMRHGAEFLLTTQDVANKGGIDDGLLGAGKSAGNVYEKWRWASDNSFGYLALRAAEKWAVLSGETANAERYHAAANQIIVGINSVLHITNPLDPNYKLWHYAVDENHNPQTEKGRNWINYAPQMLDIPAMGVGDNAVGEWIHTHLQKGDGSVVWADTNNSENPDDERKMKSPGYSFQASLSWFDLGQTGYAALAKNWALNSGLWQYPNSCDAAAGGWIDWVNNENGTGAQCWERFIDTSFYAITTFTGGYDFDIPASFVVANNPSLVTIENRQINVQKSLPDGTLDIKRPYFIEGVAWNPATRAPVTGPNPADPQGAHIDYGFFYTPAGVKPEHLFYWWQQEFENHYIQDIALMKDMGVNTVRVYLEFGEDGQVLTRAKEMLDELYNSGIMVVMTVATSKDDLVGNPPKYEPIVNRLKNHPAILMWSIGNEWNLGWALTAYGFADLNEAITLINTAAVNIKALDTAHPVTSALGDDFGNIPTIVAMADQVDIWGINVYRGTTMESPISIFEQWTAITNTKPFYFSEYGTDSFSSISSAVDSESRTYNVVGAVSETTQAEFISGLLDEIREHQAKDINSELCAGGLIFEFNDELYKSGNYHVGLGGLPDVNPLGTDYMFYNNNGFAVSGHPDGVANEEHFGLVDADRNIKDAYNVLAASFVTNTAIGAGILFTDPASETTLIFDEIVSAGHTEVAVSTMGPAIPSGFQLQGNYYDITTTAIFSNQVRVCLGYDETGLTEDDELALELVHFENGSPVIVTEDPNDTLNNVVCGNVTSLSPFAVLRPNRPPAADAGIDQTVECAGHEGTAVTLDGANSADADGDELTYRWTGPFGEVFGVQPTVTLPLGGNLITLSVDDGHGAVVTDDVQVTVQDTVAPDLSVQVHPKVLWPPDHKMILITPTISVLDICDSAPQVTLKSITMNEGELTNTYDPYIDNNVSQGNTNNDIQVDSTGRIFLRAERAGKGSGRVYTIIYTATDASGNSHDVSATVTVPHNR